MYNMNVARLTTEEIDLHTGLIPKKEKSLDAPNLDIVVMEIIQESELDDTNIRLIPTKKKSPDAPNLGIVTKETKQEPKLDDAIMEMYKSTIEHTTWQSSEQAYDSNVKIENSNLIEIKRTEQEDKIITTITESSSSNIFPQKCKAFECVNCTFSTLSETKFLEHCYVSHNISQSSFKLQQCNICLESFENNFSLNTHLKYHGKRRRIVSKRLETAVCAKIPSSTKSYKCKDCNRHFITRHKLNMHYKLHKQNLMCKKCNKRFLSKKYSEKHLLSHTNHTISGRISNDTLFNERNTLQNQREINKIKFKSVPKTIVVKRKDDKMKNYSPSQKDLEFQYSFCSNCYQSLHSLVRHDKFKDSNLKLN